MTVPRSHSRSRAIWPLMAGSLSTAAVVIMTLFITITIPVQAQQAAGSGSAHLSDTDLSSIARIEDYLNTVSTLQARFVQVSSTGQFAEGTFYLSRPGDLRIEYDPPVPILMVTSGIFLVYYDRELDQSTHVPLSATPAGVLVNDDIDLNGGDTQVTNVSKDAGSVRISIVQADDPLAGTITLMFSEAPLALRQWTVRDAQGVSTEFALVNPRFGIALDPELFTFRNRLGTNNRR